MKAHKILMPTDFSACSHAALAHAIYLARQYDAELHFLHIVVLHGVEDQELGFPEMTQVLQRFEEATASKMRRSLADHRHEKLTIIERQRRAISAAPEILQYAAEQEVDMIVLGTHGRRGLRRCLLGSVAEEVVRSAECPVVTVPERAGKGPVEPIDHLLVPFDFSDDSKAALESAKHLASLYGSRVEVLHVVAPPIVPGGMAPMPIAGPSFVDLSRELEQELEKEIEAAGGPEVPVEAKVLFGTVALQVTDYADEAGTDLIVIGSHGQTGIRRFLLGSVAERVVRSAPCPVMVLRHPAAEQAADEAAESTTRVTPPRTRPQVVQASLDG